MLRDKAFASLHSGASKVARARRLAVVHLRLCIRRMSKVGFSNNSYDI